MDAAKAVFGADSRRGHGGRQRRQAQRDTRWLRDLNPLGRLHDPNGAMNHSMLYLVMGQDNARGTILFEAPWSEPDGRIRVSWDRPGSSRSSPA